MQNSIVIPCLIVASLIMVAGCSDPQQAADAREIKRIGQNFRGKIESSIAEQADFNWISNTALISSLFANETSFVPGVKWKERYVPKAKKYTSGDGEEGLVDIEVAYDRIRTRILNPDVSVGGVTPEFYMEYLENVLPADDIAKLNEIRKRTKCFDKFKEQLERANREEAR